MASREVRNENGESWTAAKGSKDAVGVSRLANVVGPPPMKSHGADWPFGRRILEVRGRTASMARRYRNLTQCFFRALLVAMLFGGHASADSTPTREPRVEVDLTTSQTRIELGVPWELYATVRNLSEMPIWISDKSSVMMLPAVVRRRTEILVSSTSASFPEPSVNPGGTDYLKIPAGQAAQIFWRVMWDSEELEKMLEARDAKQKKILDALLAKLAAPDHPEPGAAEADTSSGDSSQSDVASPPAKSSPAFGSRLMEWIVSLPEKARAFRHESVDFHPGKYQAKVVVHYWLTAPAKRQHPEPPAQQGQQEVAKAEEDSILGESPPELSAPELAPEDSYISLSSMDIDVQPSPYVTLFGGGIGGLLGFFLLILSHYTSSEGPQSLALSVSGRFRAVKLLGFFGAHAMLAVLLGVIVTILVSRLGDTKFFVTVTINDIWGSITMGLIAELTGVRVLEKLLGVDATLRLTRGTPMANATSQVGADG